MKVIVRIDKSGRLPTNTSRPRWHQWLTRGYDVKDGGLTDLVTPAVTLSKSKPEATVSRAAQNCTFEVF